MTSAFGIFATPAQWADPTVVISVISGQPNGRRFNHPKISFGKKWLKLAKSYKKRLKVPNYYTIQESEISDSLSPSLQRTRGYVATKHTHWTNHRCVLDDHSDDLVCHAVGRVSV